VVIAQKIQNPALRHVLLEIYHNFGGLLGLSDNSDATQKNLFFQSKNYNKNPTILCDHPSEVVVLHSTIQASLKCSDTTTSYFLW